MLYVRFLIDLTIYRQINAHPVYRSYLSAIERRDSVGEIMVQSYNQNNNKEEELRDVSQF